MKRPMPTALAIAMRPPNASARMSMVDLFMRFLIHLIVVRASRSVRRILTDLAAAPLDGDARPA